MDSLCQLLESHFIQWVLHEMQVLAHEGATTDSE